MHLDIYRIHKTGPEIVPAGVRREWMDSFPDRHPYRCLPLAMANVTGWEILCPAGLTVTYDGGHNAEAISLRSDDPALPAKYFADSHFREGILTFHTGHLFRTPPGWGLWAMGPPNTPKKDILALAGLIETDWLPFPFTMNWQLTRPTRLRFEKGEPFCFILPIPHMQIEQIEPQMHELDDNPELKENYTAWSHSRRDFLKRLEDKEDSAIKAGWQRHYMRGEGVSGEGSPDHRSKRRMKPIRPRDPQSSAPETQKNP